MAQITQPHAFTRTQEEDIDITFRNANNLCRSLEKLDNLIESIIFDKEKEKWK